MASLMYVQLLCGILGGAVRMLANADSLSTHVDKGKIARGAWRHFLYINACVLIPPLFLTFLQYTALTFQGGLVYDISTSLANTVTIMSLSSLLSNSCFGPEVTQILCTVAGLLHKPLTNGTVNPTALILVWYVGLFLCWIDKVTGSKFSFTMKRLCDRWVLRIVAILLPFSRFPNALRSIYCILILNCTGMMKHVPVLNMARNLLILGYLTRVLSGSMIDRLGLIPFIHGALSLSGKFVQLEVTMFVIFLCTTTLMIRKHVERIISTPLGSIIVGQVFNCLDPKGDATSIPGDALPDSLGSYSSIFADMLEHTLGHNLPNVESVPTTKAPTHRMAPMFTSAPNLRCTTSHDTLPKLQYSELEHINSGDDTISRNICLGELRKRRAAATSLQRRHLTLPPIELSGESDNPSDEIIYKPDSKQLEKATSLTVRDTYTDTESDSEA